MRVSIVWVLFTLLLWMLMSTWQLSSLKSWSHPWNCTMRHFNFIKWMPDFCFKLMELCLMFASEPPEACCSCKQNCIFQQQVDIKFGITTKHQSNKRFQSWIFSAGTIQMYFSLKRSRWCKPTVHRIAKQQHDLMNGIWSRGPKLQLAGVSVATNFGALLTPLLPFRPKYALRY